MATKKILYHTAKVNGKQYSMDMERTTVIERTVKEDIQNDDINDFVQMKDNLLASNPTYLGSVELSAKYFTWLKSLGKISHIVVQPTIVNKGLNLYPQIVFAQRKDNLIKVEFRSKNHDDNTEFKIEKQFNLSATIITELLTQLSSPSTFHWVIIKAYQLSPNMLQLIVSKKTSPNTDKNADTCVKGTVLDEFIIYSSLQNEVLFKESEVDGGTSIMEEELDAKSK